jgi:hypothetical protein
MTEPKWDREDLQRVIYHIVSRYRAAVEFHGIFDELLDSAIMHVAIPTLKDNNWWPDEVQGPESNDNARLR